MRHMLRAKKSGFTIVELLIVIVVIGIIAAITIISYAGITDKANTATLQSDLKNASTVLKLYNAEYGSYPATGTLSATSGKVCLNSTKYCFNTTGSNIVSTYIGNSNTYTLKVISASASYQVTESLQPSVSQDGIIMQTITSANCPNVITRAVDARDNHTYWVQKLSDGKCWMLTNLGYAGLADGNNTYGDVKTLIQGISGNDYASPLYYVVAGGNITTEPVAPSISAIGSGQYGYLYNWCAAMGAQTTTSACSGVLTAPTPTADINICPFGWRLPTMLPSNEFFALNSAVNNGLTNTDAGLIASPWLGQRSGLWGNTGFANQGVGGYYWTSYQYSANAAYNLSFISSNTYNSSSHNAKSWGFAVRCIAN